MAIGPRQLYLLIGSFSSSIVLRSVWDPELSAIELYRTRNRTLETPKLIDMVAVKVPSQSNACHREISSITGMPSLRLLANNFDGPMNYACMQLKRG